MLSDCPKCYFDLKDYDDLHGQEHSGLVPQEQTVKSMRTGTKKLLQTGLDKVKVMAQHRVRPQYIHWTLPTDAHRETLVLAKMAHRQRRPPT